MSAPNMATLTASLERSLQNCSLSQSSSGDSGPGSRGGIGRSSSSQVPEKYPLCSTNSSSCSSDTTPTTARLVELNSHISLPYHWEQCLDLKTGEIYYINWRNGMRAKEDPRMTAADNYRSYYSASDEEEEEDEDDDDDDDGSYDSEGSLTEPCSSAGGGSCYGGSESAKGEQSRRNVLVVGGCKSCLMYFMVPKHVEDCPKCTGQLLHFDRSDNEYGSPLN